MLSVIGRHCQHIKSLKFYSNGAKDLSFARKYGHRLEELALYDDNAQIEHFLPILSESEKR